MRIIHTSDWHLGQTWDRRNRYDEFEKFLHWMLQTVKEQKADVLLIVGDIFDTQTPLPRSQSLYYNFLRRMMETECQTVIVAGNHDSPQLIDAPSGILTHLQIHVVGEPDMEKELIEIKGKTGKTELLIAAVPFLRDKDLRQAEAGESAESREQKSLEGIRKHYQDICGKAEQLRNNIKGGEKIPLIATGHLFVTGGMTSKGVRDIYVGTLGQVTADIFPKNVDYVALGHLHIPQIVAKSEAIRYSGSPIPMNFDEANQKKSVVCLDFNGRNPTIELLPIPSFSNIIRIQGGLKEIQTSLANIADLDCSTYVDIFYTGSEFLPDLNLTLRKDSPKFIEQRGMLQIRVENVIAAARLNVEPTEKIEELTPVEIFKRRMDAADKENVLPREELLSLYKIILADIDNEDNQSA